MNLTPDSLFRALADPTRLRSIVLLQREGELCVCEFTHALDLTQPKISRHLAILREDGIVSDRRAGHWVYYRLNPDLPDWARTVIEATTAGVRDVAPYANDQAVLADMPNRPGTRCCA
ncbi:MAG: metalloregulator ArsR/SmtB family transcription factor [Gammaproteobacteria bacterium]|nr:metalloregulator ArsR/SmtB family transcription factor [Gammaproteobacteria bacterium]